MTLRNALLAALTVALVSAPAVAAERLSLRGDVTTSRDMLTLGDLVSNAPADAAASFLFRAPPLGQSGTIQARRIRDAAEALGLSVETGGRLQVTVTRAARRIGPAEIEGAVRTALARDAGLDEGWTGIRFEGASPALLVEPHVSAPPVASELSFDPRSRRLSATVWVGTSSTDRNAAVRVTGTAVDLVEVAVLARGLDRGETVRPGDVNVERRPREGVPGEALLDGSPLPGRVARRSLSAGTLVRSGDLARPDVVAKGDTVTVLYEAPGMTLSLRGKASEAGALGDTISILGASKKILQAVVTGPGRVSVNGAVSARTNADRVLASAGQP
jgi:flagellar basal body P-ring formation protein FlgA